MSNTALIIDDEADIRELIAISLNRIGMECHTAANLAEATNLLQTYTFDVCLTDMRLPDGNGVDFVRQLMSTYPNLPVAVITAHGNMDAAVEAMKNGAFDFVSKPVDINQLRNLVKHAMNSGQSAPKNSLEDIASFAKSTDVQPTPLKQGNRLVGNSPAMVELREMIKKVTRTNAPVWITGESGTGKELIASLIHANSPRAKGSFVAINCGAIPSELMESELFGHKRGSFTGAHTDHEGLFSRARGGTLFLDEVAELPLHMQVKLLRAIQERTIRPVGAVNEIDTDVRILSASHKNLSTEANEGRFRHDLYYRLNVICVEAPALRDRPEDIQQIANVILEKLALREGQNSASMLSYQAISDLTRYNFPGNVRELENILERAVALSDNNIININDLALPPTAQTDGKSPPHPTHHNSTTSKVDESATIRMALEDCRWNRKLAADKLGLTYRQLRYRIDLYGLNRDSG